jgi:hypothetical protein
MLLSDVLSHCFFSMYFVVCYLCIFLMLLRPLSNCPYGCCASTLIINEWIKIFIMQQIFHKNKREWNSKIKNNTNIQKEKFDQHKSRLYDSCANCLVLKQKHIELRQSQETRELESRISIVGDIAIKRFGEGRGNVGGTL